MKFEKVDQIAYYLYRIAELSAKLGSRVAPFMTLDQMLETEPENADAIVVDLRARLSVLELSATEQVHGVDLEIKLFRRAMEKMGLRPADDFSGRMREGDIIAVYDDEYRQIFSSLEFFRFCNYDLFTFCSTPFYELYSRAEKYDRQIIAAMNRCLNGPKETRPFDVEPHILRETSGPDRGVFKIYPKLMTPVMHGETNEVIACAVTFYCKEMKMAPVPSE